MIPSRILIVENEEVAAKNIQHSLESLGYTVSAIATSGPEAIERASETRPNLVLLQLRLNGGVEGAKAAAHLRVRFGLPVIYLTAHTDDALWQQIQPSEPFGYVLKPFPPRELQLAIEATLQQRVAARKLNESEQRFHQFISSISDHTYMTQFNADGSQQNLYISPQIESLTGYPRQEFVDNWRFWPMVVIHPEDRATAAIQANKLADGCNSRIEYRLIRSDGEIIWVRDSAMVHQAGDAKIVYGLITDVTAFKQIETALQDSLKRLTIAHQQSLIYAQKLSEEIIERKQAEEALHLRDRAIMAVPTGISIADASQPDMPLIYCNPAFEEMTGYAEAEVLGQNCRFLQGPETDPVALNQIRKALRQGSECQVELINYRKDGSPFWNELTISPIRDEAGRLTHYVGIQNDITRRKLSEEQLRAGEERFRRVISSISDHIYVSKVSDDGTLDNLYLSPHAEALTGYPLEKFMADWSFWPSTIHPDDRAVAAAQANQLTRGQNSEAEYRIIRADGQIIWVRDSGRTEREDSYTIIYGVVSDITRRKLLEEQLRQSQKLEAVGRLAGGVAHDFNNLLTVIIGDCELILNSDFEYDETLLEDVASIKSAGERAAALTRQLLAFSRKQILEPKVLNLNTIVTGVDKLLRRLMGAHIELVILLEPQLKSVKVDLHQLEQVIVNLAVNARDAMPKGGRLTIETTHETLGESSNDQEFIKSGDYVKLIVRDTGMGLDAETQSHIFEPFFTTKRQGKGTGLGLATVYGIVQQSGGHITVVSAPGQGATFTVYLPQAEIAAETPTPQVIPVAKPAVAGLETILLVEDEAKVRDIIRKFLQKAGYTVLEAHNSEEALSFCQEYEGSIHLLVTDVMMPGLSGPELAERLISSRPSLKILYMSGYADEVITQQTLAPEAVLLQKPFTPDALARKAWELLQGQVKG